MYRTILTARSHDDWRIQQLCQVLYILQRDKSIIAIPFPRPVYLANKVTCLLAKHESWESNNKSWLDIQTNNGDWFDLCHYYRQSGGWGTSGHYLHECTVPMTWQVPTSFKCLSNIHVVGTRLQDRWRIFTLHIAKQAVSCFQKMWVFAEKCRLNRVDESYSPETLFFRISALCCHLWSEVNWRVKVKMSICAYNFLYVKSLVPYT